MKIIISFILSCLLIGLFIGLIILVFTRPEIAFMIFLASAISLFTLIIYAKIFYKNDTTKRNSEHN